jgi:hypothetical protein
MRVPDVRGTKIQATQPPLRTYGKGRVCEHHDCGAVLNQYNSEVFCGLHSGEEQEFPCDECGVKLPFTSQWFWATRHGLLHTCKECQGFKIRHAKFKKAEALA